MSRDGYQSYAQTRGAHLIVVMHDRGLGEENHVGDWHAVVP
jgi:hypothetical protein